MSANQTIPTSLDGVAEIFEENALHAILPPSPPCKISGDSTFSFSPGARGLLFFERMTEKHRMQECGGFAFDMDWASVSTVELRVLRQLSGKNRDDQKSANLLVKLGRWTVNRT